MLERIKRLGVTDEEAQEILAYDKICDGPAKVKTPFDLTPEQEKVARSYCKTGTRKKALNLPKKERKVNATKVELVNHFANFLSKNSVFSFENVTITNKERQISFTFGGETYELTLVQKRKPKK